MADKRIDEQDNTQYTGQTDHEDRDVKTSAIWYVGLGAIVAVAAIAVLLAWLLNTLTGGQATVGDLDAPNAGPVARATFPTFPEPRLQTNEYADLDTLESQWKEHLESYAWTNKEQGRVRLKIDRAIDIIANERKLPVRSSPVDVEAEGFFEPEAADWNGGQTVDIGR